MKSHMIAVAILICCIHLPSTTVVAQWQIIPFTQPAGLKASSFLNADTGFIAAGKEILRTTNGGSHWTSTSLTSGVWSISAPADGRAAFAGGEAIYRTTDAGETWDSIHTQRHSSNGQKTNAVSFLNADFGCIAGNAGIEYTTSGGIDWAGGEPIPVPFNECHSAFVLNRNVAYLGGVIYEYSIGSMMKTTDGGATWRHVINHLPLYGAPNGIRAIHFFSESKGMIGGPLDPPQSPGRRWRPHVLRTSDGGQSWRMPDFEFWYNVNTITFADSLRGFIGDEKGNIYSTTDGGTTWKNDNVPSDGRSINSICVAGGSRVFAVGDGGLILRYDLSVSVQDEEAGRRPAPTMRLYPNPTTGRVRIDIGEAEAAVITIIDMMGRVRDVGAGRRPAPTLVSDNELDVSALPTGTYVVVVRRGTQVYTELLVKAGE